MMLLQLKNHLRSMFSPLHVEEFNKLQDAKAAEDKNYVRMTVEQYLDLHAKRICSKRPLIRADSSLLCQEEIERQLLVNDPCCRDIYIKTAVDDDQKEIIIKEVRKVLGSMKNNEGHERIGVYFVAEKRVPFAHPSLLKSLDKSGTAQQLYAPGDLMPYHTIFRIMPTTTTTEEEVRFVTCGANDEIYANFSKLVVVDGGNTTTTHHHQYETFESALYQSPSAILHLRADFVPAVLLRQPLPKVAEFLVHVFKMLPPRKAVVTGSALLYTMRPTNAQVRSILQSEGVLEAMEEEVYPPYLEEQRRKRTAWRLQITLAAMLEAQRAFAKASEAIAKVNATLRESEASGDLLAAAENVDKRMTEVKSVSAEFAECIIMIQEYNKNDEAMNLKDTSTEGMTSIARVSTMAANSLSKEAAAIEATMAMEQAAASASASASAEGEDHHDDQEKKKKRPSSSSSSEVADEASTSFAANKRSKTTRSTAATTAAAVTKAELVNPDDVETEDSELEEQEEDPYLVFTGRNENREIISWKDYLHSAYLQNKNNDSKPTDLSDEEVYCLCVANTIAALKRDDGAEVKQHGRNALINGKAWHKFSNGQPLAKEYMGKLFDQKALENMPFNSIVMAVTLLIRLAVGDEALRKRLEEDIEAKSFAAEAATHKPTKRAIPAVAGGHGEKKVEIFSGQFTDTLWGSFSEGSFKYSPHFFDSSEGCYGHFANGIKLVMMAMMGKQDAIRCIVGGRRYDVIVAHFSEPMMIVKEDTVKAFAAAGLDHLFELVAAAC